MHVIPSAVAAVLLAASPSAATTPAPKPTATPAPVPAPASLAAEARLVPVATGLHKPVEIVFAPGDTRKRMFVVEQVGTIRVVQGGAASPTPFLDLTDRVSTNHPERGLLGLAFHPQFAKNGKLYVNFTDRKGNTNVVELRIDRQRPDLVDLKSERRILFVEQPFANHDGGNLQFGPDGKLWIGLGDGGSGGDPKGNGQNPNVMLAKMLRVDVDAPKLAIEIWAKGLRNPWRYSFDRKTGELWIADVGQNKWEEVDAVPSSDPAGKNFGWNVMEGTHCYAKPDCSPDGMVMPLLEYPHTEGCSITGGYVYRGKALPDFDGLYFYADFCTAFLRSLRVRGGKAVDSWNWREALDPHDQLSKVSAFGEDADGELYIASLDGTIFALVPAPAPAPARRPK